jgi:hypothetical protein
VLGALLTLLPGALAPPGPVQARFGTARCGSRRTGPRIGPLLCGLPERNSAWAVRRGRFRLSSGLAGAARALFLPCGGPRPRAPPASCHLPSFLRQGASKGRTPPTGDLVRTHAPQVLPARPGSARGRAGGTLPQYASDSTARWSQECPHTTLEKC